MTRIRKINVSQVEGGTADNTDINEIRPNGETAFYLDDNDKLNLMMFDGARTHLKSKVLSPGVLYGSNADSGDGNNYDTIKLIPDAALHSNGSNQYIIVDPTAPNHIHIRAGGIIDDSNAALILGGENSNVEIQAGLNPPVYVRANNNTWMFDTNGSLSFPGSSNARIGEDEPGLVVFSDAGFAVVTNANSVNTYEVEFIGYVSNGFGDDTGATLTVTEIVAGTITDGMTIYGAGLPPEGWAVTFGGGVMEPQGTGGTGNYLLSGANILTSSQSFNNDVLAEGSNAWVFDNSGNLTLPNDAVIRTDGSNVEVSGVANFNIEAAGVVNIYTDTAGVAPHQWQFGDDGSITFPDGTTSTGAIVSAVQGSSFIIQTLGSAQASPSNVLSVFEFGVDGSLTFPDNTVQTTAYVPEDNLVKVSDEWAVTTGTNTYSFTVPSDGTYIMWVKGNIPNGIITWNATVSVSNTNVPAIGTQYAWNYTGGGSPIALTSIPDQIIGSAGTISTDATYAGTTSNRFDFGISNTSESTQTVYYGYTKIS